MKKVRNVQCFRVALHGFSMRSTFCLFAEKEVFNHNILTALSPVKNLCVTVWRTDEEQTYCPFCSQIPVADVVLSALIASHADVTSLRSLRTSAWEATALTVLAACNIFFYQNRGSVVGRLGTI